MINKGKAMINKRIGMAITAGSALIIAGIAGCVAADDGSAATPETIIPIFQNDQVPGDALPEEIKPQDLGIAEGADTRHLGSDSVAEYWVTLSDASEVCLVMHIPGGYEVAGSTCGTLSEFNQRGLKLKTATTIDGDSVSRVAYLFPSDVELTTLEPVASKHSSLNSNSDSFVAMTPEQNAELEPHDMTRTDGANFTFYPLGS